MMEHTNLDQARGFAEKALQVMDQHAVAAVPRNYQVWFAYVSGANQALSRAIDDLIRCNATFTPDLIHELYRTYCIEAEVNALACESGHKLQVLMQEIDEELSDFGRSSADYSAQLVDASGELLQCQTQDDLRTLIKNVMAHTQVIVQKNQNMANQLEKSSDEISALRQDLERVEVEANTDALTGLANRKHFDQRLALDAATATEEDLPLCLLLTDIDHFKKFNDTYGHRVGDEVLKLVGRCLKDNLKGKDLPARYGGEEFCVLLPTTTMTDAEKLAENIRAALASREIKNKKTGESFGKVTLSIGVAQFRPGETLDDFVRRADQALYKAKSMGRNRVVPEALLDNVVAVAP